MPPQAVPGTHRPTGQADRDLLQEDEGYSRTAALNPWRLTLEKHDPGEEKRVS